MSRSLRVSISLSTLVTMLALLWAPATSVAWQRLGVFQAEGGGSNPALVALTTTAAPKTADAEAQGGVALLMRPGSSMTASFKTLDSDRYATSIGVRVKRLTACAKDPRFNVTVNGQLLDWRGANRVTYRYDMLPIPPSMRDAAGRVVVGTHKIRIDALPDADATCKGAFMLDSVAWVKIGSIHAHQLRPSGTGASIVTTSSAKSGDTKVARATRAGNAFDGATEHGLGMGGEVVAWVRRVGTCNGYVSAYLVDPSTGAQTLLGTEIVDRPDFISATFKVPAGIADTKVRLVSTNGCAIEIDWVRGQILD